MRNREAVTKIAARQPFTGSNFRGEAGMPTQQGRLDPWPSSLLAAKYVVYSYATPIAWYAGGQWYATSQRFSPTTSRHQSVVRSAVNAQEV